MRLNVPDQYRWIDSWLARWAVWIGGDRRTIYHMLKAKSLPIFSTGGSSTEETFDLMADREEAKQCQLLDSVVRNIEPYHWRTIQIHYCRLPGRTTQEALSEALEVVQRSAIKRGLDPAGRPEIGRVRRVA